MEMFPHCLQKAAFNISERARTDDARRSGIGVNRRNQLDPVLLKNRTDLHLLDTFLAEGDVIIRDFTLMGNVGVGFRNKLADQDFHKEFLSFRILQAEL